MRWIRGLTLAGVGMLAGCLEAKTVHCDGGVVCPEGLACALAPVYCEAPARVEACAGAEDFTTCTVDAVAGACRGGACFPCTDTNELAGCAHTGWFAMPSNTAANLTGVWTSGPGEAYAVGGGTIVRYDGFRWAPEEIEGVVTSFTAVWASDSDHVFATTSTGEIYRRMEGGLWSRVHQDAMGYSLVAISGSGPDDVVAVSVRGTLVRSAGAAWTTETITPTGSLVGVAVQSRADVFVAGIDGTIYRSDGTTWPISHSPAPGPAPLRSIAASPSSVFAIGGGNATVRLPTGTSSWIRDAVTGVPASTVFNAIWVSGDAEALAVGGSGRIIQFTDAWTTLDNVGGRDLNAIHGSDRTNVFAVGLAGTILRYTGP